MYSLRDNSHVISLLQFIKNHVNKLQLRTSYCSNDANKNSKTDKLLLQSIKTLKNQKVFAPAGNRIRVCTVAGYYSTTRPLVPLLKVYTPLKYNLVSLSNLVEY